MFFGCCFIICISISFNLFLLYRYLYFIATADGTAISSTNDTAAITTSTSTGTNVDNNKSTTRSKGSTKSTTTSTSTSINVDNNKATTRSKGKKRKEAVETGRWTSSKVTKNGELFYVLLFSVCFICILLATSNFFCLPFKLLVVKLDVKDLKLHYFFAVNARDNATAPVMMRHGTPACHVVGSTLAVRVAVRKKMKKRSHKLRMTI